MQHTGINFTEMCQGFMKKGYNLVNGQKMKLNSKYIPSGK